MHAENGHKASWPYVEDKTYLWTWLFVVPLVAYTLWQVLYFLIVDVLRRQRLLRDPEVMTSYRELSKKAQKANNIWWRLSGLLGDQNRLFMYILLQALFSVATMALTVPIFLSYEMHLIFCINMERRKFSTGSIANAGCTEGEEEIGEASSTNSARQIHTRGGNFSRDQSLY